MSPDQGVDEHASSSSSEEDQMSGPDPVARSQEVSYYTV